MKQEKLICKAELATFQTEVMTKTATQDKLNELEGKLLEKIDELNQKLEFVKSKQWKFKIGDVVIYDKFTFMIEELIDKDGQLYKARRYDYNNVIKNAGYTMSNYVGYFNNDDKLVKLDSWQDYASQLIKIIVESDKKIVD